MKIKRQIRQGLPFVTGNPKNQVHAHSTGNSKSTAQNEADNQCNNKPSAFFTHVVGNGQIIQIAEKNRGAYDVGGGYNGRGYASVELIESHKSKGQFNQDYKIYVELLRQLCSEIGVAPTLDTSDKGVLSHDYCRRTQPNNGTTHVDPFPYLEKWGVTKQKFASDLLKGFNVSEPPKEQKDKTHRNVYVSDKQLGNATRWYIGKRDNYDLVRNLETNGLLSCQGEIKEKTKVKTYRDIEPIPNKQLFKFVPLETRREDLKQGFLIVPKNTDLCLYCNYKNYYNIELRKISEVKNDAFAHWWLGETSGESYIIINGYTKGWLCGTGKYINSKNEFFE